MKARYCIKLRSCKKKNQAPIKIGICLVLISILIIESVFVANDVNLNSKFEEERKLMDDDSKKENKPYSAANISLFENPFTRKFEDLKTFFLPKYKSNLKSNISTFFRLGDEYGNITVDTVYSIDNLLMYKSILKEQMSSLLTYLTYIYLKETPLWYQGNLSEYKYGFVRTINGTTGAVLSGDRYLVDNLMALFLLLENDVHTLTLTSIPTPKTLIQDMFLLINSTEFWDDSYKAFRDFNGSSTEKLVESNLYAILANSLIHRAEQLDSNIKTRAYYLANTTMATLIQKLWDNNNFGFNFQSGTGVGYNYKYLSTNALGIISLLDHWIETGKKNNSVYLTNATLLYDKINDYLWNSTFKAYEYRRTPDWQIITEFSDQKIDLESNALMMRACLKLFDVSGNITYYDKAIELFNSLEKNFYDKSVKSYNSSVGSSNSLNNGNKNFYSNLRLCEAYLDAFEIYNSTSLISMYNVSQTIPNFVLNQDTLQLESNYSLIKNNWYFNPAPGHERYEPYTIRYDISNATINYIFRYPNATIIQPIIIDQIKAYENGSIAASTNITCKAASDALNGTYFNITTPSAKYFVWFNLSSSGGIKPIFTDRIAIEYKLAKTYSATDVATNLRYTLQNYGGVHNVFDTSQIGSNVIVTNKELGALTQHIVDGSIPLSTNFTFLLYNGANKTVSEHIQLFSITENLTIASNYRVDIYVNTTYFKTASSYHYFNVISGLENKTIQGLTSLSYLYQGQTVNITLPIKNNRKDNITLNVTLEGKGIFNSTIININFTRGLETSVRFNITATINALAGVHKLYFIFKRGNIVYLTVKNLITIANAIDYNNLIFTQKIVRGDSIYLSMNLINFLPNNTQLINISFSGANIDSLISEFNLNNKETRSLSFQLESQDDIVEDSFDIKIEISKGNAIILTTTLSIEIIPRFEIISVSFPEKISPGDNVYFILTIKNNQQDSEEISLLVNDDEVSLESNELIRGENQLTFETIPSMNPYDFQKQDFEFVLKDSSGNEIFKRFYTIEFEINTTNFFFFYMLPIVIPIGIVLYYGNKYLKLKALRK